jgi:hypothetical protein
MSKSKEILGKCQAAYHAPEFYDDQGQIIRHIANTIDHLTPKGIARSLAWKARDFRNPNARVPMNSKCHQLKESSTIARKRLLERQKKGELITLEDYRKFRNEHDCVYSDGLSDGRNGHGETIIEENFKVIIVYQTEEAGLVY